jgi:hypothetical protein
MSTKMIFKYTLLFFISICLIGCGGKASPKKTSASFKIYTGAVSDPNLSGGVMVYGRAPGLPDFAINVTSDSLSFPIPNGSWNFYVFGWDGASPMTGTLRCGETSATLDGGDTVVSFNLSDANCSNGNFGSAAYKVANQFKPLRIVHCSSTASVVDGNSDCTGSLSANTKSYEVSFATFGSVASPPLIASCINEALATTGITDTTLNIPTGGFFENFLSLNINTYNSPNCSDQSGSFLYTAGIEAGANASVVFDNASYSAVFISIAAVDSLAFSPLAHRAATDLTSASYKIKSSAAGMVTKTQTATSASYKFFQNRNADTDKPRYGTSSSYKIHLGNQ